jgi:hypothetical protein
MIAMTRNWSANRAWMRLAVCTLGFGACAWASCAWAVQGGGVPNFAPDTNTGWVAEGQDFLPPSDGPGPVAADAAHRRITNSDLRSGSGQPARPLADLNNPILQPWVRAELKKRNDLILSGDYADTPKERCWPTGVPGFLLYPVQPVYFLQAPNEVVMIWQEDHQVRHIYLNQHHSAHVTPSWFGESVGHYEGDALVADTIGMNKKTFIDNFLTPHSDKLHVVERFRMIGGGKTLEVQVHVEDPGAFTMPWNAIQRYRRVDATTRATDRRHLGNPLEEMVCAENNSDFFNQGLDPIPLAEKPDF